MRPWYPCMVSSAASIQLLAPLTPSLSQSLYGDASVFLVECEQHRHLSLQPYGKRGNHVYVKGYHRWRHRHCWPAVYPGLSAASLVQYRGATRLAALVTPEVCGGLSSS